MKPSFANNELITANNCLVQSLPWQLETWS